MQNEKFPSPAKSKNLQARLMLIFSVLFVFCTLVLSVFLFNILQLISLTDQSRLAFEENRRLNQLEVMFKQYQLGLNNYALSSSSLAEMRLAAQDRRLDETLLALQDQPPAGDSARLETIISQKTDLSALVEKIIVSVSEQDALDLADQDWAEAERLSLQADQLFDLLSAQLGALRIQARAQLQSLQDKAELFSVFAMLLGILSIAAFLFLALAVALILYVQIHLPLEQLARAARDLQARRFNPADLDGLARRGDEIGALAQEFLTMASAVEQRTAQLAQEALEIRAKIH
ncbi:MAG: HAMP domain-containing protein [Anaerolineales bacterium]|jgi:nitrogen fixation/metabolism regulation signal transduction histidine kinase|nr:HAMP domain-containing protein [Anaerolineales bacterium]